MNLRKGSISNPFIFFFHCFLYARRKAVKIALGDLLHKFTYRYLAEREGLWRNFPKYFFESASLIWSRGYAYGFAKEPFLAYDGNYEVLERRTRHFAKMGKPIPPFIFRNRLPNVLTSTAKLANTLLMCLVALCLMPVFIYRRDRGRVALVMKELTEALLLDRYISKLEAKELHVYSAYEKDTAFLSYYLMNRRIRVTLIPSSNPIKFFYQRVVCDTFVFTAPFQRFEYEEMKDNWVVGSFERWAPFGCMDVERISHHSPPPQTLGLIGSGMSLREELGFANFFGNADLKAEFELENALARFIKENPVYSIVVFLHPNEKSRPERLERSLAYYRGKFGKDVRFAPTDQPSKKCFYLCDVGISGTSSAQIERLFGGYKTVFAPMGHLKSYFSDPRLDRISVNSYPELERMIKELSSITAEDYFSKYHLKDYRWDSY